MAFESPLTKLTFFLSWYQPGGKVGQQRPAAWRRAPA